MDYIKKLLTTPVRLNGADSSSQEISLWLAILFLILPIGTVVVLIGFFAFKILGDWSPFALIGLAGIVAIFVLYNRTPEQLKKIKLLLDVFWNIWSFAGALFILIFIISFSKARLDVTISSFLPIWRTFIASIVCLTAAGRVALPIAELLQALRPKSPPKVPAQT